jgi:hypothetical protein
MTNPKLFAIVFVCGLLVFSGCVTYSDPSEQPEDMSATAVVFLDDVSSEGEGVRLTGNVTFDEGPHNVTLQDVVLVFLGENGSNIHSIHVGTIDQPPDESHEAIRFNASFSQPPNELRLRIGTVDIQGNGQFGARGYILVNEEELRYSSFWQDEY